MRILFVTPRSPWPLATGAELRYYNLMRPLCDRHDVHLIFPTFVDISEDTVQHLSSICKKVECFRVEPPDSHTGRRSSVAILNDLVFAPSSYFNPDGYYDEVNAAIQRAAGPGGCEVAYLMGQGMRRYYEQLRGKIPFLYDIGDNQVVYHWRKLQQVKSLSAKLRVWRDWWVNRRIQARVYRGFDDLVMITDSDAAAFRRVAPGLRVTPIPNGVDATYYHPGPAQNTDQPVLLFTGIMGYEPNVDAAVWFGTEVFPIVQTKVPTARLLLVGRAPAPPVQALAKSNPAITVTGEVSDIRPWYDQSLIYVCPLRLGAGIKNKILESWGMCKPVVATSVACEGIQVADEENVLIADGKQPLADAVLRLIDSSGLREKLARNGRRIVEAEYSWEARGRMIEQLLTQRLAERKMMNAPQPVR